MPWNMLTDVEERVMEMLSDFALEVDILSAERSHWACMTKEQFRRAETLAKLDVALMEFSSAWEKKRW